MSSAQLTSPAEAGRLAPLHPLGHCYVAEPPAALLLLTPHGPSESDQLQSVAAASLSFQHFLDAAQWLADGAGLLYEIEAPDQRPLGHS